MGILDRGRFFDALRSHIGQSAAKNRASVLIVADIRQLHLINGQYGYDSGDRLLRAVADRIGGVLRDTDILGSLDGGRFGILLPDLPNADIARLAIHKIDSSLEEPLPVDGETMAVNLSYGLAWYPEHARNADQLLNRAELALATARARGSHSVVFDAGLHNDVVPGTTLISELRQAMEAQQLELYFQPKIDLSRRRAASVEALVRWRHPQRGLVGPGAFVPQIEKSPLIIPFTEWSLNVALRECADLQRRFPGLCIAVNLSANVLYEPELIGRIESAMSIWNIPAERLVLEVTESAMMRDPAGSLDTLCRLSRLGITVSIDDFGTGYSSLAYLKQLPVEELKIDKSFIIHMLDNPEDQQIVQSVIDLAHNLKISVIAEGVESEDVARSLSGMGCDTAQGFYFARPMPREALVKWLETSEWGYGNSVCGVSQKPGDDS